MDTLLFNEEKLYIKIIEGDFVHARANATRKYDACSDAMAVADALQTHLMRRLIRMKKERIQVAQFEYTLTGYTSLGYTFDNLDNGQTVKL